MLASDSVHRILLVSNLYEPYVLGGAEKSVGYLAQGLRDLGKEVHVLTLFDRDETEIKDGIHIHRIRQPNVYWYFKEHPRWLKPAWHLLDLHNPIGSQRFLAVVDQIRPDLIHTHNLAGLSTSIWAAAKSRKIPIVHTIRDYYLMCLSSTRFKKGKTCQKPCGSCKVASWVRLEASKNVDGVIGISQHVLNLHMAAGGFSRAMGMEVIPNAYLATHSSKEVSGYNSSGKIRLGYMGEISSVKGVAQLLEAMHHIPNSSHHLDLAGRIGPEAESWFHPSNLDRHVEYLGVVSHDELLPKTDVLVVPSLWEEPLGRVAIEAACWKVPVLVTPRGGLGEIVKEKSLGWTLPDSDSGLDWVDMIQSIKRSDIDDFRQTLIGKETQFMPTRIAARHLDFYERIISTRKSAGGSEKG